ncbi:MAG: 2-amino-4-hydroxy-6-hydroxymethyldihydropteridine diphosphokinase [Moheibacter sp.]
MSRHVIILLLGSNLFDKKNNLSCAKSFINNKIGNIINESKIIETKPEEFISKNNFLNQTLKVITHLSPTQLLKKCKEIETEMGRVYLSTHQKHQDRLIDIDILMFNNIVFKSKQLTLPHHQIKTRNFVKKIINYDNNEIFS